jgi:hypothetical protein
MTNWEGVVKEIENNKISQWGIVYKINNNAKKQFIYIIHGI